ncbi:MAG: TetR family transcriptional regulator, partial [Liquorilactobacillus satsumensis]
MDLRYKRTELVLHRCFAELLTDYPFSKLTVRQITQQALINRNTFYLHYKDKYELLLEFIKSGLTETQVEVTELLESPFKYIASIADYPIMKIIIFQKDDLQFINVLTDTFFSLALTQTQEIPRIFLTFGKITAIFKWVEITKQDLDFFKDYKQLDQ